VKEEKEDCAKRVSKDQDFFCWPVIVGPDVRRFAIVPPAR
jgi:hypothetical protein